MAKSDTEDWDPPRKVARLEESENLENDNKSKLADTQLEESETRESTNTNNSLDIVGTSDKLPEKKEPQRNENSADQMMNNNTEDDCVSQIKEGTADDDAVDDGDIDSEVSDSHVYDSDVSENDIDALLDKVCQNLDEEEEGDSKPQQYNEGEMLVLLEKGINHSEVLPEGWIQVTHRSGMPIYLHRPTRVCTMSKPYFIGTGSVRKHNIPVSTIPCLQYLWALNDEILQEKSFAKSDTTDKQEQASEILDKTSTIQSQSLGDQISAEHVSNGTTSTSNELTGSLQVPDVASVCPVAHGLNPKKEEKENESELSDVNCAKVETEDERIHKNSLSHDEFRKYCQKRFIFKALKYIRFKTWGERREYEQIMRKTYKPMYSDGTERVTAQITKKGKRSRTLLHSLQQNSITFDHDGVLEAQDHAKLLWVGGIGLQTSDQGLKDYFGIFGEIVAVNIVKSKSYCIIWFKNASAVDAVIDFDGVHIIEEKKVTCKKYDLANVKSDIPSIQTVNEDSVAKNCLSMLPTHKEWVVNPSGKTFLCLLQQYAQDNFRIQPTYEFKEQTDAENAVFPHVATVVVNQMRYCTGYGSKKKFAKNQAAMATLDLLVPDVVKFHNIGKGETLMFNIPSLDKDLHGIPKGILRKIFQPSTIVSSKESKNEGSSAQSISTENNPSIFRSNMCKLPNQILNEDPPAQDTSKGREPSFPQSKMYQSPKKIPNEGLVAYDRSRERDSSFSMSRSQSSEHHDSHKRGSFRHSGSLHYSNRDDRYKRDRYSSQQHYNNAPSFPRDRKSTRPDNDRRSRSRSPTSSRRRHYDRRDHHIPTKRVCDRRSHSRSPMPYQNRGERRSRSRSPMSSQSRNERRSRSHSPMSSQSRSERKSHSPSPSLSQNRGDRRSRSPISQIKQHDNWENPLPNECQVNTRDDGCDSGVRGAQLPENAATMHPVMVLHQMKPEVNYKINQITCDNKPHFNVFANIDGIMLTGEGQHNHPKIFERLHI